MAIEQFALTAPPNTLFQGISTNYQDNLTYVEYLLGVLKKMNEVIEQVNSNSQFIAEYDGRIEKLEVEFEEVKAEIVKFESDVNEQFAQLESDLTNTINNQLIQIKNELLVLLNAYRNESRSYTDTRIAEVEAEIDSILIGQITVHDPTTGYDSPLQTVINNIYDSTREEALTATEYDALELTATTYDGYEITAFNYDQYGKTILTQ